MMKIREIKNITLTKYNRFYIVSKDGKEVTRYESYQQAHRFFERLAKAI